MLYVRGRTERRRRRTGGISAAPEERPFPGRCGQPAGGREEDAEGLGQIEVAVLGSVGQLSSPAQIVSLRAFMRIWPVAWPPTANAEWRGESTREESDWVFFSPSLRLPIQNEPESSWGEGKRIQRVLIARGKKEMKKRKEAILSLPPSRRSRCRCLLPNDDVAIDSLMEKRERGEKGEKRALRKQSAAASSKQPLHFFEWGKKIWVGSGRRRKETSISTR
jgi:hypothetical protein